MLQAANGKLGDLEHRDAVADCSFLELDFGGAGGLEKLDDGGSGFLDHLIELFGPVCDVWIGPFLRDVIFQRRMVRLEDLGKGQRLRSCGRGRCSWFSWRGGGRQGGGAGWEVGACASKRWPLGIGVGHVLVASLCLDMRLYRMILYMARMEDMYAIFPDSQMYEVNVATLNDSTCSAIHMASFQ